MKQTLPRWILACVGSLLVLTTFVPPPDPEAAAPDPLASVLAYADRNFSVWFNVLAVFAFVLGAGSLLRTHGARVASRGRDWPYSLLTLVSFVAVLALGLLKVGGPPGLAGDPADEASWLTWVFTWIYAPLRSTVYALLAFFVASAAYRAFRLRSGEAGLMLASAMIVLLGRTPFGTSLTAWLPDRLSFLGVDVVSFWILTVPTTAGWRAVLIGIALGIVATSLRLILGIERQPLGGKR